MRSQRRGRHPPHSVENPDASNAIELGLALIGKGQVWAHNLRIEAVGTDVPLTTEVFAAKQAQAARAAYEQSNKARAAQKTPPQNLALR